MTSFLYLIVLIHLAPFCHCVPTKRHDVNVELAELRGSVESLRRENVDIKARLTALESTVSLKQQGSYVGEDSSNDAEYSIALEAKSRQRRATGRRFRRVRVVRKVKPPPEVAFQAVLETLSKTFDVSQPLTFDSILVSKGNAFDPATGIFTAPQSGTYMFNLNVLAEKDQFLEFSIKVNDKRLVSAISDNRRRANVDEFDQNEYNYEQGSTNVILELTKGETISAGVVFPYDGKVSVIGERRTSFSGYMMRLHHHNGSHIRSTLN